MMLFFFTLTGKEVGGVPHVSERQNKTAMYKNINFIYFGTSEIMKFKLKLVVSSEPSVYSKGLLPLERRKIPQVIRYT